MYSDIGQYVYEYMPDPKKTIRNMKKVNKKFLIEELSWLLTKFV